MSTTLRLKFNVISNDHDGYCSGGECEEDEKIVYKNVLHNIDEYFEKYNKGDKITGADFEIIKEEYEDVKALPSGSCYCNNMSSKYDIHTENWILLSAKVIDKQ